MEYKTLDAGTQFKIFDRVSAQVGDITSQKVENGAMVWLMNLIAKETKIAYEESEKDYENH